MALIIRRPRSGNAPVTRTPPASHPKAIIKGHDSGTEFVIPYAPRGADLAGQAAPWSSHARPGRKPLALRDGDNLATESLTLTLARPDHQDHVEDYIAALRALAKSGDRITLVNLSPSERGPWRISNLTINGTLRQAGTNYFTRAEARLDLLEASDANPKVGPVSGGHGGKGGAKLPTFYTVKKGDTLRQIAEKFYGDPSKWKAIARANDLKDPDKLKVGAKLKIPKLPKPSDEK